MAKLHVPHITRQGAAALALAFGVSSQALAQESMAIVENVRSDWGRVLRVDPVHQTVRANRVERQCTMVRAETPANSERGLGTRIFDAVRGVIGSRPDDAPMVEQCRDVYVPQEFTRPIAYDVEYMYGGVKYRSRLPFDPGNRVRLRVSVMPIPPDAR